jgi:glycosyltransferase involved in cell wall biosynthesis
MHMSRLKRDYVQGNWPKNTGLNISLQNIPQRYLSVISVYTGARCVFAVSTRLAERIQEIAPRANIKVVGNLVRESVYQLRRTKRAKRSRFQIISISSLIKAKRIDNAIDAIAALPERLKRKVTYHVIGQGPEREALEIRALRAGVDVIFYGGLSHDLAMQHLSNADMLLHPSSYETFGIVLAEAMAVGLPVIATRCGGPETIVSDETGILVSVDNLKELTDAIAFMLDHIEDWKKNSFKITKYSRSLFHENSIVKMISQEYL